MKIQQGKYYQTAEGRKGGPAERNEEGYYPWRIPLNGSPLHYHADGTICAGSSEWRIVAEWADDAEYKTLRELDVKPGDVVEHEAGDMFEIREREPGVLANWYADDSGWGVDVSESSQRYRIVFRAETPTLIDTLSDEDWNDPELAEAKMIVGTPRPDTPTLWRDMTPEQKGALLLAHHEGRVVEYHEDEEWRGTNFPAWHDDTAYRIRPEPVRQTVTLHGAGFDWGQAELSSAEDTHRITFDLINGKPDCASIKMEEV